MLNGETRRAPAPPPDSSIQAAWEEDLKVSKQHMVLPQTTLGQISLAPWTDQPPLRKKRKKTE
jgi:hypothetical protein